MKKYKHDWLKDEWERMGRPEVEIFSVLNDVWIDDHDPQFNMCRQYRIKCKPSINWDHVHQQVKFLVKGVYGCGTLLCCDESPKPYMDIEGNEYWETKPCTSASANAFLSFTPGTCDWRDSLVMRPVVVGEEK